MSSIFMMKQVIDYAHEEIKRIVEENEGLKKRIRELENGVKTSIIKPTLAATHKNVVVNDADFEEESMNFSGFEEEEEKKTEENKVITVTGEANKREHQREYQRLYRERKKNEKK